MLTYTRAPQVLQLLVCLQIPCVGLCSKSTAAAAASCINTTLSTGPDLCSISVCSVAFISFVTLLLMQLHMPPVGNWCMHLPISDDAHL
jgi:hypothetical protein